MLRNLCIILIFLGEASNMIQLHQRHNGKKERAMFICFLFFARPKVCLVQQIQNTASLSIINQMKILCCMILPPFFYYRY
jgi:hypothetical protein